MSSGVNHNINGVNRVKWSESQYRWSKSRQVLCSLVKPSIGFFSHVKSSMIYWDTLHIIYGAKPETKGVNHDIDGCLLYTSPSPRD